MMRSLQSRMLVAMIGSSALLLLLFGVLIYTTSHRAVWGSFDESLAASARVIAASMEWDTGQLELEFDPEKERELAGNGPPLRFQIWDENGAEQLRSRSLGDESLPRFHGEEGRFAFLDQQTSDHRPERLAGLCFMPNRDDWITKRYTPKNPVYQKSSPPRVVLVVARDARAPFAQLQALRNLLLLAGAATLVVSLIICFFVTRRGFGPLRSLAGRIADIREEDLFARLENSALPAELVPVVDRLNLMLGRLREAFARERSFTADVAHELRTPLAGVRTTLEVALTRERETAEYREAIEDSLAIACSMQGMVENLLALARLDAGRFIFSRERIFPAAVLERCWASVAEKADHTWENRIPTDLFLETDPAALEMVLRNLVANAVAHGSAEQPIRAEAYEMEETVEISLTNSGCALTREQASQAFLRFWRGDPSRQNTGAHCGLGLALVQRISQSLGGRAEIEVAEKETFRFRFFLPRK